MRTTIVIAVGVLAGGLALAGCGGSPHRAPLLDPASPSSVAAAPSTSVAPPGTIAPAAPTSGPLPISIQSDTEMQSAGNEGPSSSILAPTSCVLSGGMLTAAGGYTNGGFAPNVYNRYGDVVELYAYTTPSGAQVAQLNSEHRPPIGGYGTWQVNAPVNAALGLPTRCVVAAQPTHAVQLAP